MAAAGAILSESIASVQTLGFSSMDQQLTTCFLPDGYNSICNDIDDDEFISDDNDDIKRLFAGFPTILDHLDPHYSISEDFDPRLFDIDQYQDENPLPGDVHLLPDLFESLAAALTTTTPFEYPASSHNRHHQHKDHHPSAVSSLPLTLSPSTVEEVYGGLFEGEEEEEEEGEKSRLSSSSSSSSSSSLFTNIPVFVESGSVSEDDEQDDDDARRSRSRHAGPKFNDWDSSSSSNGSCKYVVPRTTAVNGMESTALTTAPRRVRRRKDQLWYFLLEILGDPEYNPNYIQWENKDQGIFRFIESKKVAQLWGAKKKRSGMTYEYFARAMRHYYSRGIMRRVTGRRLVYQFGPKAENWKGYAQQVTVTTRSNQDNADCCC